MSQKGMTLLELMIALSILSTLMVFSATSIQQAITTKGKIQEQLDDMSRVRDSLRIIERDINLAYHYIDLEAEFREKLKAQVNKQQQPGTGTGTGTGGTGRETGPQPAKIEYKDEKEQERKQNRVNPVTEFIGSENDIYFPTLNSGRVADTMRQSDAIKVGYFMDSCTRPGKKNESINTKCLFRKRSNLVEPDFAKGGEPIVLLEYISEFKLRYKGPGKQDWVSEWKTNGGDGQAKGKFPTLIEVNLVTEKGTQTKPKRISMQMVVPVRFPNNPDPKAAPARPGSPR